MINQRFFDVFVFALLFLAACQAVHTPETTIDENLARTQIAATLLVEQAAPTTAPSAEALPVQPTVETPVPPTPIPTPSTPPIPTPTSGPHMPYRVGMPLPSVAEPISAADAGFLVEMARWGDGRIDAFDVSPDEQLWAAASMDGVRLYNAQDGELAAHIPNDSEVTTVRFAPDGSSLATGDMAGRVRLWSLRGELLQTWHWGAGGEPYDIPITDVRFTYEGDALAAGSQSGTAWYWNTEGQLLLTFADACGVFSGIGRQLAFAPDGNHLAAGGTDGAIQLWRLSDGGLAGIMGHPQAITGLQFSPDSSLLASSSEDASVRLWRVTDGAMVGQLPAELTLADVSFNATGELLAALDWYGNITFWEINGQRELGQIIVPGIDSSRNPAMGLRYSADNNSLIVGASWQIEQVRVQDGSRVQRVVQGVPVTSLAVSSDGRWLAVGDALGTIQVRSMQDGSLAERLERPAEAGKETSSMPNLIGNKNALAVSELAFLSGSPTLAANYNGALFLWSAGEPWQSQQVELETWVLDLAYSSIANIVAVSYPKSYPDSGTKVALLQNGSVQNTLDSGGGIGILAFSADGSTLAVGTILNIQSNSSEWRAQIEVFDAISNARLATWQPLDERDFLSALSLSQDGSSLAISTDSGVVQVWRVADHSLLYTLDLEAESSYSKYGPAYVISMVQGPALVFSQDGGVLFSMGAAGQAIEAYDTVNGQLNHTIIADPYSHGWQTLLTLTRFLLSPDGRYLLAGRQDGSVSLWGAP